MNTVKRMIAAIALAMAFVFVTSPIPASAENMPKGDLPGWKQILADNFNGQKVALGKFSDCNHNPDTKQAYCAGLPEPYKSRWWAYPRNWPDTANQRNYPQKGVYNPEQTVWIGPSSTGDGQMHIKMFRKTGMNQVATIVPKKMMDMKYGRYAVRFKAQTTPGYKLAWLLWPTVNDAGSEIDFPELELDENIHGFMHYRDGSGQDAFDSKKPYGVWRTAVIEWKPNDVKFYLDGKLIGHSTKLVPNTKMSWDIQSESALNGDVAKVNSSAQIDITWIAGWSYSP